MAVEVTCSKCQHKNPLGRMYCMRCGELLNMESLDPRTMRSKPTGPSAIGRLLRVVVLLALCAAIVQLLRPVNPMGQEGSGADAQRLRQKLGLLKGAVLDQREMSQRVSEAEINSYLASLLSKTDQKPGRSMDLRKINVTIRPEGAVLVLVSGVGPVTLTTELAGTPTHRGDQFEFVLTSARLGHLPMPGPLVAWLAGKAGVVFSRMDDEKRLLNQMEQLAVGQGEVVLGTGASP